MNPLYNFGIHIYRSLAHLVSRHNPKVSRMISGQRETLSRLKAFRKSHAPEGFDVWFHVASLGEFEQARPIIERLLEERPGTSILVSFFSPSGYEVRHSYDPRVAVVYLPFDTPANVRAFLDAASPKTTIFVKYEFWGNYLTELQRRGIPTYIISAIFRPTQVFFRPWGAAFRRMLRCFDRLYVQDDRSRKLLAGIGITNVTVAGDTRFDRVWTVVQAHKELPEIENFASEAPEGSLTLVVGSSWPLDEDVYIPRLLADKRHRAIIAPHEFDARRLADLVCRFPSGEAMLFSEYRRIYESGDLASLKDVRILIIDCFGLLSSIYRFADVAYIGGGFGAGIHNINEAAAYGVPVVFGPRHGKFKEASDLIECGGGFCVESRDDFERIAGRFESRPDALRAAGEAAGSYIRSHIGASNIIFDDLFKEKI